MTNDSSLNFFQKIQLSCMRGIGAVIRKIGIKKAYTLSTFMANLLWNLNKDRRELATKNIAECLHISHEEAKKIAQASFRHNFCAFAELVFTQDYNFLNLGDKLRFTDPELFHYYCTNDRPNVGATGHFGAWEILGTAVSRIEPKDKPRLIVSRKYRNIVTQKFIVEQRSVTGTTIIGHRDVVMPALRALRKNGSVSFLIDHRPTKKSDAIFLPFFGKETPVNMGPALLAVRTKALVWPMYLNREEDATYTCHVYKPLDCALLEGTQEEKIHTVAEFYTKTIENHIRKFPEQWFWLHNRWKPYPEVTKKKKQVLPTNKKI